MTFDFAAAIAQRPNGDSRAALIEFYGDPTAGSKRTGKGQFEPSNSFRKRLVKIPISELPGFPSYAVPGVKITGVTFHEKVAPVFVATWAEVVRRGLADQLRTYDGAVTFRHMLWNYNNPVSLHAYAAAIDFDARWNGYGIPHEQMQINREVVRCFEECGWHWGGRWGQSDGMHFQWTDPLRGVQLAEWQDAMAKPAIITPEPVSSAGRRWEPVYDPATEKPIPGEFISVRQRADGELRLFKVPTWRLKEEGML